MSSCNGSLCRPKDSGIITFIANKSHSHYYASSSRIKANTFK